MGITAVTSNSAVEVASMTNPYTAVGFQILKLVGNFNILKGKTSHISFSEADNLAINLMQYLCGYERKYGNYNAMNNISNVFIDNIITRMTNDTAWTIEKDNIITDFNKLKNNAWEGISPDLKYEVVLRRLFLWIFLNLDAQKKETFAQFSYSLYNNLIAFPARDKGIDCAVLLSDGKVSADTGKDNITKVAEFFTDIFGGNKESNSSSTNSDSSNTIYFVIGGIMVFLIIIFLIFRKG
jgi:hypothetical protein